MGGVRQTLRWLSPHGADATSGFQRFPKLPRSSATPITTCARSASSAAGVHSGFHTTAADAARIAIAVQRIGTPHVEPWEEAADSTAMGSVKLHSCAA